MHLLPLGKAAHEQDAARLLLLATAAGEAVSFERLGTLMSAIGWSIDGAPPRGYVVGHWAAETNSVLRLAGWNVDDPGILVHDPRASLLALLAVRAR